MSAPELNELEIAERERIVREMNQRRHIGRRSSRLDLKPIAEALRISRTGLRAKIRQLRITIEDLHICSAPDWLVRITALLLCTFSPLLLFSTTGCRSTPGEIKYRVPVLEYEQSDQPATFNLQLATPAAIPAAAAPATRTWLASWSPWTSPVPARILIQWSSTPDFRLQTLAFHFPSTNQTGQFTTPYAENNFFRTGYTITR